MLEAGIVVQATGQRATVRLERHSACAECGICHKLAHEPRLMLLDAHNVAGASPGDLVRVSVPDIGVVRASFWAYGVPMIGAVLGGVAGWLAFAALGLSGEAGAAVGGVGMLVAAFGVVSRYDRRLRSGWRGPEVVEIIGSSSGQEEAQQ